MDAKEVAQIANELRQIAERLAVAVQSQVVVPQDVAEHVASCVKIRECLQCGKTVRKNAEYIRGLCRSDYQKTYRWMKEGIATESSLMILGKLAPENVSGRPPKNKADKELLEQIKTIEDQSIVDAATIHPAAKPRKK